jgi:hypothetical protein
MISAVLHVKTRTNKIFEGLNVKPEALDGKGRLRRKLARSG